MSDNNGGGNGYNWDRMGDEFTFAWGEQGIAIEFAFTAGEVLQFPDPIPEQVGHDQRCVRPLDRER